MRAGVPFKRFWTSGHPAFAASGHPLLTETVWTWNPNGDCPNGQAPCDGANHVLAITTIPDGMVASLVNAQFALALDNAGDSAALTATLVRNRAGVLTVLAGASVFHPYQGFSLEEGWRQNPCQVLPDQAEIQGGDVLGLVLYGSVISPGEGPNYGRGPCTPGQTLPCASAVALYGLAAEGEFLLMDSVYSPIWSVGQGPWQETHWLIPACTSQMAILSLSGQLVPQQPFVAAFALDGQIVAFVTVEDYYARGGIGWIEASYAPDWQMLPAGELTLLASVDFGPSQSGAFVQYGVELR